MNGAEGKGELKIVSTLPLTNEEKDQALKKANKFLGNIVKIEYQIDPSILGGLVFKTKDKILDLSVAGKLNQVKNLLNE